MHSPHVMIVLSLILFMGTQRGALCKSSSTKTSVETVLTKQAQAWNKGDLDTFMQGYLKSDTISYVSGGKEVTGYEALKERYLKKYGEKPESMGKLSFSDLRVEPLGDKHAMCIGHWSVERQRQADISGIFTLILEKNHGRWKVIHDHTSVADTK